MSMHVAVRNRVSVRWVVAGFAIAGFVALPATGAEKSKEPERPPLVDPRADTVLRAMSEFLAAAKQFSYQAQIDYDEVLPTGQKIERGATQDVAVRRPDRAFVEFQGDDGRNQLWYDGNEVTILDGDENVYAVAPMPSKIDAAIDRLLDEYGFTAPLSDFLQSDPYQVLRPRVQFGLYVGQTMVDGVRCHHLAFVDKAIDWQIWIEDGTQLVPRKLVITYTSLPGQPRFAATFSDWELDARFPDLRFEPWLPPSAAKVDFLEAAKKAEETK